nr:hypothetical protein [Myxococcota bacterium]
MASAREEGLGARDAGDLVPVAVFLVLVCGLPAGLLLFGADFSIRDPSQEASILSGTVSGQGLELLQ